MHADEYGEVGHGDAEHEWLAHDHRSPALDMGEEERLPWLESADDVEPEGHGGGPLRLIGFAVVALLVLALLVGAIYWVTHRGGPAKPADGSLIEASKDPYKIAPSDPGGKKFAGTGDESFKVSQGEHPDASLAGSAGNTPPLATAQPSPSASPPSANLAAAAAAPKPALAKSAPAKPAPVDHGGSSVAVQVGAYSSSARAEAEWSKLSGTHDLLKGLGHRVVEGKADIGTVYRLQALAADSAAANSLCSHLEADGVKCQVKR